MSGSALHTALFRFQSRRCGTFSWCFMLLCSWVVCFVVLVFQSRRFGTFSCCSVLLLYVLPFWCFVVVLTLSGDTSSVHGVVEWWLRWLCGVVAVFEVCGPRAPPASSSVITVAVH
ncbi:hypothetical protein TSUD_292490 [Trifolium subterraneum]|uniref:Transmembrane protein n=1 Tax=Trifolium subterraneum TaxID=3900 RepID=A0A2Z6P821_TRISU|nr:hypothetical protein TSUD_292490 [Trifolium subterraneum]